MYSTHIQWINFESKDFKLSFRQHPELGDAASLSVSADGPFSVNIGEGFSHDPSYPAVNNALGITSTPIPGYRRAVPASTRDPAWAPYSPKSIASSSSVSSPTPHANTGTPFQPTVPSEPWTPSAQTLNNFTPAVHSIPVHATPVVPKTHPSPRFAGIPTPAQPSKPDRHHASDPNADGTYAAYVMEVCRSTGIIRIDILLDRTERAKFGSFAPIDQLPARLVDQMRHSTYPNALSIKFRNLIGARHPNASSRAFKKVYDKFLSRMDLRTVERLRIEVPDQLRVLGKGDHPNTLDLFPALKRFEWKGSEDCTLFPWRDGSTRANRLEGLSIEANMTQRDCLSIIRSCPDLQRLSFDLRDQAGTNDATSTQAQVAFSSTEEDSVALSNRTKHVDLPKLTTLSITSSSDVNLLLTRIVGRPNSFRWVLNLEGEALVQLFRLPFIALPQRFTLTAIDLSTSQEHDGHMRSLRASLGQQFAYTTLRVDVHDGGVQA